MRRRGTPHYYLSSAVVVVALTAVLSSIGMIPPSFGTGGDAVTVVLALSTTTTTNGVFVPKHHRHHGPSRAMKQNGANIVFDFNRDGSRRLAASKDDAEQDDDGGCGCKSDGTTTTTTRCGCRDPPGTRRRQFLRDQFVGSVATATASSASSSAVFWSSGPGAASAKAPEKSRTEGYPVQRTEREWSYVLSGAQYNVLRRGGTERQKSSILNTYTERDSGTYYCAACPTTALFESTDKFSSGTGWPSFARALPTVEREETDPITATLGGREVRCSNCGGHLGDLFNDGWVYVGTKAFETGNRYCIDGAALIFKPSGGGEDVYGDTPPPNKAINYEPAMFRDNSINSRL